MEKQCIRSQEEHSKLMKIINFRLPHAYKKIGLIGAIAIFGFLIFYKFYGANTLIVKDILRTVMIVLLLLASLSKEQVEDEFVSHIRSQSYVISFVCAIAYSIVLPLVSYVLDVLITNIRGDGTISFDETSAFQVMFMLICFQLLFFETLKRFERAQ